MEWLESLEGAWLWLVVGVVLASVELVAPGYFLIWLALAAIVTALLTSVLGMGLPLELFCFAVFSIVSVALARRWLHNNPIESTDPLMNDRGGRLVGQGVVVTQAIEGGTGRVRHGDSEWIARGDDAPVGSHLVVVGHDGVVLLVGPSEARHTGDTTEAPGPAA